jgi:hypothetical protein
MSGSSPIHFRLRKNHLYRRSSLRYAALLILWAAFGLAQANAQADVATATLKGVVSDSTNAVIVGASMSVRSVERGTTRATQTDAQGNYQIPLLHPGAYDLHIEASGFKLRTERNIVLAIGQIVVLDVSLNVGETAAQAPIDAQVPLLEVERTQQANIIDRRQIANLPTISRSFIDYVFTLPGVTPIAPTLAQQTRIIPVPNSGFSIGGNDGHSNYITIDGGENESGSGGLRIRNLSVEAIQEFQVNRNAFAAEYGFTAGTAINVITLGGTNQLHGRAYAFYRSQKLAARNPFDFGARKPFEQALYPGFTLGGPIVKNKAFFFTSYEAFKLDRARFRNYTNDPSNLGATAVQADYIARLSSGPNATDVTRRIAAGLQFALATPNFPTTMRILRESEGSFNAPARTHNWTTRLDYQADSRNSFTGRFTLADEDIDLLNEDNTIAPSRGTRQGSRDYTGVVGWSRLMGNFVNQARVQLSRSSFDELPRDLESTGVNISGLISFGRGLIQPLKQEQRRYLFEDLLSWNRGAHNFTIGGSYRPVRFSVSSEAFLGGSYIFSGGLPLATLLSPAEQAALTGALAPPPDATLSALQAFNLGLPVIYQQGFGNPTFRGWQHNLGLFAEDSWKVRRNLTLDLGLRLDYDGEPKPLQRNAYLSPRVGFALDVRGDHKTVVRGGFGTFVAPSSVLIFGASTAFSDSGDFINVSTLSLQPGPRSSAALWAYGRQLGKLPFRRLSEADLRAFGVETGPKQPGRLVSEADRDFDNLYSIQASLGVSQQLTPNLSIELAYQMYRGVHIPIALEGNYRETGQSVVVPGSNQGFLFGPSLAPIDPTIVKRTVYSSAGNSIYHGMTASLSRRFSDHIQFQVNYTLSKTIDDVFDFSADTQPFLPTRRYLDRGLSAFDVRHNFVASGVFDSPFKAGDGQPFYARALADISLSPVVFVRSGVPFNLYLGRDVNGDFSLSDRPFYAPRNSGSGPSFFSANMRFTKRFYIRPKGGEGLRVEFIAEAANLFNRTNFLRVNDVVCGAAAGQGFINGCDPQFLLGPYDFKGRADLPATSPLGFVSASTPRQFQFGLKLAF